MKKLLKAIGVALGILSLLAILGLGLSYLIYFSPLHGAIGIFALIGLVITYIIYSELD